MTDSWWSGSQFPELALQTAQGAATSLSAHLGGRLTLVNFLHSTWCADCVSQLYALQRQMQSIAAAGANIVAITRDEPAVLDAFLVSAQPSLSYTVLADPTGAAYQQLGVGDDTLAVVLDSARSARWAARWKDHPDRPGLEAVLQAIQTESASGA
jgi:peroxiredoxin